tara:strand:- start:1911 stop:2690 length:780 start_codon:yes stop_codon:yes gene_type:complete
MVGNTKLLKFFYNALLTGLPSLTYNPYNKNILHAPFCVNELSTYINYKLDNYQLNVISNYLDENTNDLKLIKTSIFENEKEDYYLSINIYNCSSPIFSFIKNEPVIRCEINTYVVDKNGVCGTLIIDYNSNILSLDPDNFFKKALTNDKISFNLNDNYIVGNVESNNLSLDFDFNKNCKLSTIEKLDSKLIKYTDNIFYKNGLYDKAYYDSSLIHNKIIKCSNNVIFNFLNIEFENPESVFYFQDSINFVGGLWYNLYD